MDKNENYYCHFREHSCEVLFEQDNEQQSISTIILDAIINVRIHIHVHVNINNTIFMYKQP